MNGNIIGEPFDEFVQDQIGVRQSNQFGGYNTLRTNDQLQYLNNRNAWVKLASSVDVLEGDILIDDGVINLKSTKLRKIGIENPEKYPGSKLAESAILFNTLSSYTNSTSPLNSTRAGISNNTNLWNDSFAYGIGGTDYGIQPPPGIIGATVDSLNRGSIRKANITLKAHNKFQFDVIELLYLRLGFTMMLEWGWDRYLDNETGTIQPVRNTIIEEEWFTSNGITQLEMLRKIQLMRKQYDGNYDGFFGKVSNFTWNFNPDGSYDISIDLITLGDVIESLKANTSVKEKFYSRENGVESEIKFPNDSPLSKTNIAKVSTLNTLGYFLYKKIEEYGVNLKLGPDVDLNFFFLYRVLFPKDTKTSATQYYIKLDELFSQLESLIIPKVQNDGSNFTSQIEFQKTGNLISYFPNQIPLDPRVCIFQPPLNSYGDITGITPPSYLNSPTIKPYTVSSNGYTYGILTNLYINFEFIAGLLIANGGPDQELSLFKFLQDLCNGINNALGGVNKLEPIIKDDYKITIIDQTLSSPDVESQSIASLEVYGYNPDKQTSNFVKDIKFVSKITPQLASTISIGATAAGSSVSEVDGTAFSKWSEGLVDRFTKEILEPDGFSQLQQNQKSQQEKENRKKYQEAFAEFTLADRSVGTLFREAIDSFQTGFVKIFGFFNPHAIAENVEKDNDVNERRIVRDPFNKSLDGLPMYFEEYYSEIIKLEEQKLKDNIYKADDISELASTNYAIYLAKAFGGSPNNIKVEYVDRTANQIITGLGSATSFENSRATVENLTISELESRYREFDDTFISQGKSAYKTYINNLNNIRYINKQIASSEIGFIPLSFELVLDGISGIKIYQKLNINNKFLPSNYPESLKFIITKVNHNISNNSWDTSLSTISIPVTEPYPLNLSNTPPTPGDSTSNDAPSNSINFDPGNLFTFNQTTTNAWKLKSDSTIPVENGFLHRYPGMLVEADTNLYKRLDMQNSTDSKKLRLFYPVMPHFVNLVNAYEKAVSENGETFLQRYGKLTINSAYRSISNTPGGSSAASPGTSRHGLGLAIDLQQPASHEEVHTWFKTNAPDLGWMRLPILSSGINETWHWEFQYEGPYAKIDKNVYATASNIQNNGRNGIVQYKSNKIKEAKGVEFLNAKYLIDATGKVFGKQITAQTLPPQ
jgi:hypothetical protein